MKTIIYGQRKFELIDFFPVSIFTCRGNYIFRKKYDSITSLNDLQNIFMRVKQDRKIAILCSLHRKMSGGCFPN